MARTRAQAAPPRQSPPWLITYSDLMTLLLAFFVLLVSISAADHKKQQAALESVADTFGVEAGEPGTTTGDRLVPDLPPDADHPALRDLGPLRMKTDDKAGKGMVLSQNGLVQVVSLSGDVLFKPGSTRLSPEGEAMLEKIAPILRDIPVPLLLAGHSANLRLQGLMGMPPFFDDGERARPYFAALRELHEALCTRLAVALPHLSMGMSGDCVQAVEEGATIVRIGTDIFGARPARI